VEQMTELGFYTLAGHSDSPHDLVEEVRQAEQLGLGSAFVSERFNLKDASTLCGAAGAVSETIGIATAATNHNTRHPLVTATFATTMHRLTGGRFALGLGRGFPSLFKGIGLEPITSAQIRDVTDIFRRLWKGEAILGHDGPAGRYPYLHQDADFNENIPILLVAMGEKTLEEAGSYMDAVVLHTFFGDEALTNSVASIRRGAERVGRDPASVRVWSALATIGDHIDEAQRLKKTVGRLASYLRGYGDVLVKANGWDPAVLARFRADDFVQGFRGAFDAKASTGDLEYLATLLPDEWTAAAAVGTPEQCSTAILRQFELGADSVILHGATPSELAPILPHTGLLARPGARCCRSIRDAARSAPDRHLCRGSQRRMALRGARHRSPFRLV
jgi:5,10-methylenetetrahydromethanopterin reductase